MPPSRGAAETVPYYSCGLYYQSLQLEVITRTLSLHTTRPQGQFNPRLPSSAPLDVLVQAGRAKMASFQSLPYEIHDAILEIAVKRDPEIAAGLACVSPQWQTHIEKQTFRSLRVDQNRLDGLRDIVTPTRRAYVRHIEMDVLLPGYTVSEARCRRETPAEQHANNEAFTEGVCGLLSVLAAWKLADDGEGVALVLRTYSLNEVGPRRNIEGPSVALRGRLLNSYLDFTSEAYGNLPQVPVITAFNYTVVLRARYLVPRVCCEIASTAPNLRRVDWDLNDDEKNDPQRRRHLRQDFAASLGELPESLRYFRLAFNDPGLPNQSVESRAYDTDTLNMDPLSLALRTLSQRLIKFELEDSMVLGSEFFWPIVEATASLPSNGLDTSAAPSWWSALEELSIHVSQISPQGTRLFDPNPHRPRQPPRLGASMMNPNIGPGPELLHRYFLAAGSAVARMPRLTCLAIRWGPSRSCQCCVLSYKVMTGILAGGVSRAELRIRAPAGMDIADEVKMAWCAASSERLGTDAELDIVVDDREGMEVECGCAECMYQLHDWASDNPPPW